MDIKIKKYKIISLILMYLVYINIFLMGDDFLFASYHVNGIKNLFINVINYRNNGRLIINLLESLILLFDRYLYIIIMPIVILFIVRMIIQLCSNINNKAEFNFAIEEWLFCIFFFAVLAIDIKRETLYWISGSFNYLYPAILILIYSNIYYKIRQQKKAPWYLPILGLLLGTSSEQISLMACGIFGCTYIYQIIYKKEKIYRMEIFSYILVVLGTLSLFLSSGTMNRVGTEGEKVNVVQNIFTLIYNCSYSKISAGILSAVILIEIVMLRNYVKKGYKFFVLTSILSIIILMCTQLLNNVSNILFLGNIFVIMIFLINSVLFFKQKWENKKDISEILWLLAGIGSQIMLLMIDVWGFRTTFPWILSLLVIIGNNINKLSVRYKSIVACLLISGISVVVSLIGIILIILTGKRSEKQAIYVGILIFGIIIGFIGDVVGYHSNQSVHLYNIEKIQSYKNGKLYLKKVKNPKYGWDDYDEFHTKAMLGYYQKDKNIRVVYK